MLSAPDDVLRASIEAMARVGIGYLHCGWPSEGQDRVESFARGVMVDYVD